MFVYQWGGVGVCRDGASRRDHHAIWPRACICPVLGVLPFPAAGGRSPPTHCVGTNHMKEHCWSWRAELGCVSEVMATDKALRRNTLWSYKSFGRPAGVLASSVVGRRHGAV